jgi:hypothetical protein
MKFAAFIAVFAVSALGVFGQTGTNSATPLKKAAPPYFILKAGSIEIPERGTVPTAVVLVGNSKVTFEPPMGCSITVDDQQRKITYTSTKSSFSLITRFYQGSVPTDAEIKQQVPNLYPTGVIVENGSVISEGGNGSYWDVRREFKNGLVLRTRHAVVSYSGGLMEIVFTCDESDFNRRRSVYTWLLNSLKVEQRSALE